MTPRRDPTLIEAALEGRMYAYYPMTTMLLFAILLGLLFSLLTSCGVTP